MRPGMLSPSRWTSYALMPRAGEVWGPPLASGRAGFLVSGSLERRPSQQHAWEKEGLWFPCVWLGGQLLCLALKLVSQVPAREGVSILRRQLSDYLKNVPFRGGQSMYCESMYWNLVSASLRQNQHREIMCTSSSNVYLPTQPMDYDRLCACLTKVETYIFFFLSFYSFK